MEYPAISLIQAAGEIADGLKNRKASLERDLAALDARAAELERQLSVVGNVDNRFASYEPKVGNELQCPKCWMKHGQRGTITPTPGTNKEDHFRCNRCDTEFAFRKAARASSDGTMRNA